MKEIRRVEVFYDKEQTLQQSACKGHRISIFGDVQNLITPALEQPQPNFEVGIDFEFGPGLSRNWTK